MDVGAVIRALRTAKGQSLESVALEAGTDGSNLSRIERGLQKPSAESLHAVARALGTSVAELYALSEGKALSTTKEGTGLRPEDMSKEAGQARRYFRMLKPEYQKIALELLKTLTKVQHTG